MNYNVYWNLRATCWTPVLLQGSGWTREQAVTLAQAFALLRPERSWGVGPEMADGITMIWSESRPKAADTNSVVVDTTPEEPTEEQLRVELYERGETPGGDL